ncbi:hypothetical protein [Candidatus Magnetominusculus dajiuhuensis]
MMIKTGDMATDARVHLSDGSEASLSGLLRQGNTLLVFLRHFG